MQFILSEKELEDLRERAAQGDRAPNKQLLQELCTKAADSIILTTGWRKGNPWGCILSGDEEWYCDQCPAKRVCPHPNKRFSK